MTKNYNNEPVDPYATPEQKAEEFDAQLEQNGGSTSIFWGENPHYKEEKDK